ncbi:MAG: hypothetical protein JW709_09615 [Sedimentisphaerales bacterium]|nr:hypothetical protein [Sedimentisphaerales bacterium]
MSWLKDPLLLILLYLSMVCLFAALNPQRRRQLWLGVLLLLLFAFPRAGGVMTALNLPLPVAGVLSAVLITEWLLFRRRHDRISTPIDYFFLAYALIAGLSLGIGLATGGDHKIALIELCFYLFAIGIYFYASETFRDPGSLRLIYRGLLVISVAVSVYGIAQKFLGGSILINHVTYNSAGALARSYVEMEAPYRRVLSSYGDPNVLASQLVVFVGLAGALLLGRGVSLFLRLGCIVAIVVNVLCVYYTGSRAGILCVILVGIGVLVWRTRWALLLLIAVPLTVWLFFPGLISDILPEKLTFLLKTGDTRYQFPSVAWRLLQAIPLGCGFGNSVTLQLNGISWSFDVMPGRVVWAGFNSFWLTLFSRVGVPGVIAFALLLLVLFINVIRHIRAMADPVMRAVLVGCVIGLMGQMTIWLVNNTYMLPGGGLNFWFLMGLIVAAGRTYAPWVDSTWVPKMFTWRTSPSLQAAASMGQAPMMSGSPGK